MSAPNFYRINARNLYVVDNREYYDPIREEYLDEWQDGCEIYYNECMEDDIREQARNSGFTSKKSGSNPIRAIATQDFWLEVAGVQFCVEGCITINPGYYAGATLDWDLYSGEAGAALERSKYMPEYCESLADEVLWESDWNEGLKVANRGRVVARIRRELERVADILDNFCREACHGVYTLAYLFSNGEAGYTKIA